jgi:hypothetical protein
LNLLHARDLNFSIVRPVILMQVCHFVMFLVIDGQWSARCYGKLGTDHWEDKCFPARPLESRSPSQETDYEHSKSWGCPYVVSIS